MPASTFQSESFQKMLVIGVQAKDLHLLFIKNYYKVIQNLWKRRIKRDKCLRNACQ